MMRRTAVDFYSNLFAKEDIDLNTTCELFKFAKEDIDLNTTCELFKDLPILKDDERLFLDSSITFEEVTDAVKQLSTGRVPGLDGLTAEFYKSLW